MGELRCCALQAGDCARDVQVESALAHGGAGGMAAALLRAAADTCPRQLLRSAAASLRALLAHPAHGAGVRHAVVQALSAPDFPGMTSENLGQPDPNPVMIDPPCGLYTYMAYAGRGGQYVPLSIYFHALSDLQACEDQCICIMLSNFSWSPDLLMFVSMCQVSQTGA